MRSGVGGRSPADRAARWPARRVGWPATMLIWALATAMALLWAWQTKVGPSLPVTGRHGVHAGDVVVFALCWSTALLATGRPPRRRRR